MTTPPTDIPPYPREREADVLLRDGSTVRVRPVRATDEPAIRAFLETISPESIAFRFFGMPDLSWVTAWAIDVDYADRFALVAESGTPRSIVAHAAYVREDEDRAEVAFLVADAWQGRGISTILLAHLAGLAEQHGISTFTAQVLPANHRMIEVFRESGFPVDMRSTPDAIEIELRLNGELMQSGSTADLVHSIPALVAYLSKLMTLEPGDVVSTGTPAGVGSLRDPRVWLKPGDEVEISSPQLGVLRTQLA